MTIISHILGYPRIGLKRELKHALEKYWDGKITRDELFSVGCALRMKHWKQQKDSGLDFISVGDFAWYDHVLTTSLMLNNVPNRFLSNIGNRNINIDTLFSIARGISDVSDNKIIVASEMKKWFNTNYHYIVPEFFIDQNFQLVWNQLFDEVNEALLLGHRVKVILLGPISYLWLGKMKNVSSYSRLSLLPQLVLVYQKILKRLSRKGIEWVQIDEPILVLELPIKWCEVYFYAYEKLYGFVKLLLTTYFDSVSHQIDFIKKIPVNGLHIDLISGNDDLNFLDNQLPGDWVLSVGVVNGRNIWRSNLDFWFHRLVFLKKKRVIWVGSSCSLLHVPIDIDSEILLDTKLKEKCAFAFQKCHELNMLCKMLNDHNVFYDSFYKCDDSINKKSDFDKSHEKNTISYIPRIHYKERVNFQKKRFNLPICPITTIGSFPQTFEIRAARLSFKSGYLNKEAYNTIMMKYINKVILEQEKLGLDVLVHGEPERSDMVEYFAEYLNGFALTENGWIQSYGSRCVKPPIIFDTVTRSKPITIKWITYAQSLTDKPVKGMLTGPVTIFCWSFPREDITRESLVLEISLAIRDEVYDLEKHGIGIIQIDEPALREGLPLKKSNWVDYLFWSVECFKLITSVVSRDVQIHTHMCYSEFNDIIDSIVDMDVDVLSIEFSRVDLESLLILKDFCRLNAIGPGIYDIHSPNIPSKSEIFNRLMLMIRYINIGRLWINPDCGLKTRSWEEIKKSLFNIVVAVKEFRKINETHLL